MITQGLWLCAAGPILLLAAAVAGRRFAAPAALASLVASIIAACAVAFYGTLRTPVIGWEGVGLGLYLDVLGATMLCLVSFIGSIVVIYSGHYMDGDPRHDLFTRLLCVTLASVLLIILSGDLLQFALAWVATSVGLNRLLLFYAERPAAVLAARKKFLASRLGDACLIAAMILLWRRAHSLAYVDLFAVRGGTDVAGVLLVCTALLKSAQFPWHGWLIEVMETPTPVSALLHAGIINAGGFLVLRLAAVIAPSLPALELLVVIGGLTALYGSVVMLTQTSIKVSLAHSTIAQMGFMMLECGLGAFSAALLHIVAHSLYKAHAFLSSGSVIDIARASWTPSPGGKPHPWRLLIAMAVVLAATFAVGLLSGRTPASEPGVFALGAVLLLGLTHLIASGIDERPTAYVIARTAVLAGLVAAGYFALQFAAERLVAGDLPTAHALRGPLGPLVVAFIVLSFGAVVFLQGRASGVTLAPRWPSLHAHVANGFYINTLANRLVLRVWPSPAETRSRPLVALAEGVRP